MTPLEQSVWSATYVRVFLSYWDRLGAVDQKGHIEAEIARDIADDAVKQLRAVSPKPGPVATKLGVLASHIVDLARERAPADLAFEVYERRMPDVPVGTVRILIDVGAST